MKKNRIPRAVVEGQLVRGRKRKMKMRIDGEKKE